MFLSLKDNESNSWWINDGKSIDNFFDNALFSLGRLTTKVRHCSHLWNMSNVI
jgi:hypothetical protein